VRTDGRCLQLAQWFRTEKQRSRVSMGNMSTHPMAGIQTRNKVLALVSTWVQMSVLRWVRLSSYIRAGWLHPIQPPNG
jgi:hypothetical protein